MKMRDLLGIERIIPRLRARNRQDVLASSQVQPPVTPACRRRRSSDRSRTLRDSVTRNLLRASKCRDSCFVILCGGEDEPLRSEGAAAGQRSPAPRLDRRQFDICARLPSFMISFAIFQRGLFHMTKISSRARQIPTTIIWTTITCLFLMAVSPANLMAADAPLAGTSWRLVQFVGGDGAVIKPDDRSKYTLAFGTDGMMSVRLDCNRGRGKWESKESGQLILGPIALTRAMCPPGSMHDKIAKDIDFVRSYLLKDGHLFLSLMADAGIYEFEPTSVP